MKNRLDITSDWFRDILKGDDGVNPSEQEIQQTEEALLRYAQAHQVTPPSSLKDKIMGNIQKLAQQQANRSVISLSDVPLLTPETNWLDWEEATRHIQPPADFEFVHMHPLRNDDIVEMNIAWVKEEVPDEVHHDVLESFILLEGTCECYIYNADGTTSTVKMRAGDYISFPIDIHHEIHITSSVPAKAILQWLKVAA